MDEIEIFLSDEADLEFDEALRFCDDVKEIICLYGMLKIAKELLENKIILMCKILLVIFWPL